MAKFVKILLKSQQGNETSWRLILETEEDLLMYADLDTELSTMAYLNSGKDKGHISGTRERVINKIIDVKKHSVNVGETFMPIVEIARVLDKKYMGMHKYIQKGISVSVNMAGGWNGFDSFLKQWDGEILDTIQKRDFGFPCEDTEIIADTIILENGPNKFSSDVNTLLSENIKLGTIRMINNLKEIDLSYVAKAITKCKNVIISSQLIDDNQLNMFMEMFSKLSGKTVYLFMDLEAETKLRSHPLLKTCAAGNNISIRR